MSSNPDTRPLADGWDPGQDVEDDDADQDHNVEDVNEDHDQDVEDNDEITMLRMVMPFGTCPLDVGR